MRANFILGAWIANLTLVAAGGTKHVTEVVTVTPKPSIPTMTTWQTKTVNDDGSPATPNPDPPKVGKPHHKHPHKKPHKHPAKHKNKHPHKHKGPKKHKHGSKHPHRKHRHGHKKPEEIEINIFLPPKHKQHGGHRRKQHKHAHKHKGGKHKEVNGKKKQG